MESDYFQKKYGRLKHVSESGKLFKTTKGQVLKFNEGLDVERLSELGYTEEDARFAEICHNEGPKLLEAIKYIRDFNDRMLREFGSSLVHRDTIDEFEDDIMLNLDEADYDYSVIFGNSDTN